MHSQNHIKLDRDLNPFAVQLLHVKRY